ncbi:hypothetical protein WJX77_010805 [Trebouxia sp. C0004]
MPGLDRRSSRRCCKARAHALGSFHDDIVPGDVNNFYLKRRASPLLAPETDAGPRHDRALLHQIFKDQQSRSQRAEVLQVHRKSGNVTAASDNPDPTWPDNFQSVMLPEISAPLVQASKHKGISNEDFVVPLELPSIDPKLATALPAADGVAQPDDDLTEEEQKKLEAVGWRMLNLPLIVCHSANGMPFFFPLQKVQALVAEHKLGAAGRKLGVAMTKELINTPGRLAYVQPAASTSWAAIKQRRKMGRTPKHSQSETAQPAQKPPQPDESLTLATLPEPAELAGSAEADSTALSSESSSAESSDDYSVAADTMRSTVTFATPEVLEDGPEEASTAESSATASPVPQMGPMEIWGQAFDAASAQLAEHINPAEVYEISDLRALHAVNIIEQDGAMEYEEQCHDLAIAALSAVKAGLSHQHANLAHCRLSRKGAHALAHALACNATIQRLTLQSNHIDGEVSEAPEALAQICKGLMASHATPDAEPVPEALIKQSVLSRYKSIDSTRRASTKKIGRHGQQMDGKVQELNISDNPIGMLGIKAVGELLNPAFNPVQRLTQLILNKCDIPDFAGMVLAQALHRNTTLADLQISGNHLSDAAATAFGKMLQMNSTLEKLDLSWNNIKALGAKALAQGLLNNVSLHILNLAWNGLENIGCTAIAQALHQNMGLQELDMSRTRMGPDACVVLSGALKDNSMMERLMLHDNPLGEVGAWHLMAAITANKNLEYIGLQGSNFISTTDGESDDVVKKFNPAHPEGNYTLSMTVPAQRTIAALLCNLDLEHKEDIIKNIKMDGKPILSSVKKLKWPAKLPLIGVIRMECISSKEKRFKHVIDEQRLQNFIANLRRSRMSDNERLALVSIFAPYHYFTCRQCHHILLNFGMGNEKVQAALLLNFRLVDMDLLGDMLDGMFRSDARTFHRRLGVLRCFRPENPTGHYELDLVLPCHRAAVQRLVDAAAAEGEQPTWRNLVWEDLQVPSSAGPPEQWAGIIPTRGAVHFDYVSGQGVAKSAAVLNSAELTALLWDKCNLNIDPEAAGRKATLSAEKQMMRLRMLAPLITVSTTQVQAVVSAMRGSHNRVEAVVCLYARMVDKENLWLVLYALKGLEQSEAVMRLGLKLAFNLKRCSLHFQLNVANPEHAEVAKKLVDMAQKAPEVRNWWNIRLAGKTKSIPENNTMWNVLTTASATPILELDFLGADAHELLAFSDQAKFAALQSAEKTDIMGRWAARADNTRLRQMHPHWLKHRRGPDDPPLLRLDSALALATPPDQLDLQVMEGSEGGNQEDDLELLEGASIKPDWQVQWDRTMRRVIMMEADVRDGSTPLLDTFADIAEGQSKVTIAQVKESLISHGCTKAEAAAAEQLIKSLIAQSEDTDAPVFPLPSAAQKGRATAAPGSTSASPRDANAALAASAAESETPLPVAAAKESGAVSARAPMAATAKVVNAAGVTSSPRDTKEVVDYSMFEQIWMADLSAAVPKAV